MMSVKDFLKEWPVLNYLSILSLILYVSGFLVWNFYLYTLGFIDDSFLQTKFILTGVTFCLASLFLSMFIYSPYILFRWIYRQYRKTGFLSEYFTDSIKSHFSSLLAGIGVVFFLQWLIIYSSSIFIFIPQLYGGGQPRSLALIVKEKPNIATLNSLGIHLGPGATFQTENLCVAHENDRVIYILLKDRILGINKMLLDGYISLPGPNKYNEQICIQLASQWSRKGRFFSNMLLKGNVRNIWLSLSGASYREGFLIE